MTLSYTPLETVSAVPALDGTIAVPWGDQVNINMAYLYASMPIGICLPYAPAILSPNTLFHLADGTPLATTGTYATLFSLIGYTYGGSGTTFNLPDMRSRGVIGASATAPTGLTPRALAAVSGEENHVLITGELPPHNHPVSDPTHTHGNTNSTHSHGIVDPTHAHVDLVNNTGLGSAPAYSPASTLGFGLISDLAHAGFGMAPIVAATSWQTGASNTGISIQAASPNISVQAALTGITTSNTGSGSGHNNMGPYISMPWVIKVL